ncbi:MAG: addiction module protein [Gemmataceae bacterium]|nr:addiction module protein [Gemmataceae bacterium]
MTEAAEKLKPVLAALSPGDQAALAKYLLELIDPGEPGLTQEEWEEAWVEEIDRRLADLDSGKDPGVPAEEVFRRLREKYGS